MVKLPSNAMRYAAGFKKAAASYHDVNKLPEFKTTEHLANLGSNGYKALIPKTKVLKQRPST